MITIFKKTPNIDYLSKKGYLIVLSVIFITVSLGAFFYKGMNLGLDFRGGTEVLLEFEKPVAIEKLRQVFDEELKTTFNLTEIGGAANRQNFLLTFKQADTNTDTQTTISQALEKGQLEGKILKTATIGPKVGAELRKNAFYSIFLSLFLVLIYMAFRFDLAFGIGAIVSLFHDTLVTLGAFALFQVEFDLAGLAGVMTLIGYSLNDTIVIFDRVRENLRKHPGKPLKDIVNLSVNETLGRTILIFSTTFVMIVAMFFLGGESIRGFSFTFLVGMIIGTYSSVFIASPVAMLVKEMTVRYSVRRKKVVS